jgi:signal peptidase I
MTEYGVQIGEGAERSGLVVRSWWGWVLVGRRPARTLARATLLVVVVLVVVKWCLLPIRITGRSMEPTYRDGRMNVLNLLAYHRRDPQRGDVVGIRMEGHRMVPMKRVMGLPGERVSLRDGVVFINGAALNEPYTQGRDIPPTAREAVLGVNEYFVVGDNRDVSEYGIIARSEVMGKVLF